MGKKESSWKVYFNVDFIMAQRKKVLISLSIVYILLGLFVFIATLPYSSPGTLDFTRILVGMVMVYLGLMMYGKATKGR